MELDENTKGETKMYRQQSFIDEKGMVKDEEKLQCDNCKKWRRTGDFALIQFWPKIAKITKICKNCYKKA